MTDKLEISEKQWQKVKGGFAKDYLKRKGYKISWIVILLGFFLPGMLIFYLGLNEGWANRWVVECPSNKITPCQNNLYYCNPITQTCPPDKVKRYVCSQDPKLCLMETLPPGFSTGFKPSWLFSNYTKILLFCLIAAYGINHLAYNRKKQRMPRLRT